MTVRHWLPGTDSLDAEAWQRRHRLLQVVLAAHLPVVLLVGWLAGASAWATLLGPVPIVAALAGARRLRERRWAALCVTAGLMWCSLLLVGLTGGAPETWIHAVALLGFVALYCDRMALPVALGLIVVGHGVGLLVDPASFSPDGSSGPAAWFRLGLLGLLMVAAIAGIAVFGQFTADEHTARERLERDLAEADAEIERRRFTSDLLVNLARRNQSLLGRQIAIINQLEHAERHPDKLAELFKVDHLATRVRRNAESLLVLAGESPPRVWADPVALRDVLRAAIAETEQLERVEFFVDDRLAMVGNSVADLAHVVAELTENAVRFSPPDSTVTIRVQPGEAGGHVLTVEDTGVGMPDDALAAANALLAEPGEVDLSSVSARLGLHVVARLAQRHGITVALGSNEARGLTASLLLPASLFVADLPSGSAGTRRPSGSTARLVSRLHERGRGADGPVGGGLRTLERPSRSVDAPGRHSPPEWENWWDTTADEQGAATKDDGERPAASAPSSGGDAAADGSASDRRELRRRVPLAELAPQLRGPKPKRTSSARSGAVRTLSRYQANRRTSPAATPTTAADPAAPDRPDTDPEATAGTTRADSAQDRPAEDRTGVEAGGHG